MFFLSFAYSYWLFTVGPRTSSAKGNLKLIFKKLGLTYNEVLWHCWFQVFTHWYEYWNKSWLSMNRSEGYQAAKKFKLEVALEREETFKNTNNNSCYCLFCHRAWVLYKILISSKNKCFLLYEASKSNTQGGSIIGSVHWILFSEN